MKFVRLCVNELLGLFVDDGSLALLSLVLIAATAALVKLLGLPGLFGAGLLLFGALAILCHSVVRGVRRR
jgi:hypothetical protein